MLRHVAVFTFRSDTPPAQLAALEDGLARLPGLVPEIRGYTYGRDAGLAPGNDQFAVVADFDDAAAYARYAAHPDHQRLIATLIRPIMATRHAIQFVWDS